MSKETEGQSKTSLYRFAPVVLFALLLIGAVGLYALASKGSSAPASKKTQGEPQAQSSETEEPEVTEPAAEEGASTGEEASQVWPAEGAEAASQSTGTFAEMLSLQQVHSIRVIGDSLTAGYNNHNDKELSETGILIYDGPDETAYEVPTTTYSWASYFRDYAYNHGVDEFVNAGIGGSRMTRLAENSEAWIQEGADVIVVMLGTNDIDYSTIEQYQADAETALTEVSKHCTHMVVLSPPRNAGVLLPNVCELDEVDQVLTDLCAEKGWEHISLYDVIDPKSEDVFPDHVHPTSIGAEKLWNAFCERLGLPE